MAKRKKRGGQCTASNPAGGPFDSDSLKAPDMMAAGDTTGSPKQDQTPVKLLVFDMGHVFVDFDWSEVCKGFYERAGLNRAQFTEVLAYVGSLGYEQGLVTTDQFLAAMNEKLSQKMTVEEFTQLWNFGFHENPQMAELLQSLRRQLPLYLLSNTNENHYSFVQSQFNVARHFKELILSYEVGFAKPDERIFQEVLKRSGLTAPECLFVDDLKANIDAASALGMKTIQFVTIEDLKERLTEYGISC